MTIAIDNKGMIEFCRELIRIPSRPGYEKEVARRAKEELNELGFDRCECDDFGSVVGIIDNGDGPTIILDAHLDTVSAEPVKDWSHDPFGGWLEEDRIGSVSSA